MFLMSSSFVDTFAPPIMATKGLSEFFNALVNASISFSNNKPAHENFELVIAECVDACSL